MAEQLLTVKDVTMALGINKTLLYRLHRAGELAFVKVGRNTRITPEELARFIQSNTTGSSALATDAATSSAN